MKTSRVLAAMAVLALAGLCAQPAQAEKLVVFKNGKAIHVKSIKEDGKWLRLEFDGKDFLAVPAAGVASIEDSTPNAAVSEMKINQVANGSGGGGGGGGYVPPSRNDDGGMPPDMAAQEAPDPDDAQAALAEEQAAKQNQLNGFVAPGTAIGSRRGRALANSQQQVQPGVIPGIPGGGLQPIGSNPLNQLPINQNNRGGNPRTRGLNQGRPNP